MKARIIAKLNKRIEERLTAERDQARNARDIHASEIERLSAKLEASRVCRLTLDEELYDMRARVGQVWYTDDAGNDESEIERLTAERDQARNARDIHASEIDRLTEALTAKDDSELDAYAAGKKDAEERLLVDQATYEEEKEELQARVDELEDALRRIATRDYNETAQAFAEEALDSKEQA